MPTYKYECSNKDCSHSFELIQSMKESKKRKCPKCKKWKLIRLIGKGQDIIFKGEWGDKGRKRKKEDDTLFTKAKIARRKKNSGEIPKDAVVHAKDIDVDKYVGPKKLPKNHPENWKPTKTKSTSNK